MNRGYFIALMLLAVFMLPACSSENTAPKRLEGIDNNDKRAGYQNIKPEEAKKRMENDKNIILVDVRTPEEYAEKHIPGSILIPVDVIREKAPEMLKNKNAEIFVYCRTGRRSATAAQILVEMGYTRVYNMGGILDWPYDTVSGSAQ